LETAEINPIFITEEPLSQINVYDPFFNSFKEQYINFYNWFRHMAKVGKKAWVFTNKNHIEAFLFMEEDNMIVGAPLEILKKRRLNILWLKICSQLEIITELFLKTAIDEAIKHNIAEIYFTGFPPFTETIIPVFQNFGFEHCAKKSNNEDIYIKSLYPLSCALEPGQISDKYYPSFYDGIKVRKYVLPVTPAQHNQLFPDSKENLLTLFEVAGEKFAKGNTIRKEITLKDENAPALIRGDILLIYRSIDLKAITSLGVIDSVKHLPEDKKYVISFKWHFHFPIYVDNDFIISNNICKTQKLTRLDHRKYKLIITTSQMDNSYIIH